MDSPNDSTTTRSNALNTFIVNNFEQHCQRPRSCQQPTHVQLDYFSQQISFILYNKGPNRFEIQDCVAEKLPGDLVDNDTTNLQMKIAEKPEPKLGKRRLSDELSTYSFAELLSPSDFRVGSGSSRQEDSPDISNRDASADHGNTTDESVSNTTRSSAWMKFDPNRIVGLINTGTNCHANSVIQCLVRCEPLRVWVLTSRPRKCHRPSKSDFCCFCALRAVFRRFATADQAFYGARNLIRGLSALTNVNFTDESDANEFALLLLENASIHHKNFHKDKNIKGLSNSLLNNSGLQLNSKSANRNFAWIEKIRDFADLFTLRIKRRFQCVYCNESSSVIETHPVVHLPSGRKAVLVKQLQQFMYQRYPGRRCSKCRRYIQQRTFVKYRPPVLIVAIPRVTTCMRKTNQRFIYGRKVSLEFADRIRSSSPTPLVDMVSKPSRNAAISLKSTYDLCTIITHTGNESTTGHYSAIVRSKPSRWHIVSDEAHYRLGASEVFSRNDATLLFYVTDFVKPRAKRAGALRVPNGTHKKKQVLCSKNSNALAEHKKERPMEKLHSDVINDVCEQNNCTNKDVSLSTSVAQSVAIEGKDENSAENVVQSVDLSLPAPASSLFKLGCENYGVKQLSTEPEWENLDAPRPRKKSKKHRTEEISKSFHEFVHNY